MTIPVHLPPLRLSAHETFWADPWMVSAATQQGAAHYEVGIPLQDAYVVGRQGPVVWLVISDGVSNAPLSHVGSRVAVEAVNSFLDQRLAENQAPSRSLLTAAFERAHEAIASKAGTLRVAANHLAATLCAALITADDLFAACLGDSSANVLTSLMAESKPVPRLTPLCSAPMSAKRNATHIISDPGWRRALSLNAMPIDSVDAVLLTTDGADNFYQATPSNDADLTYILDFLSKGIDAFTPRSLTGATANYFRHHPAINDDDRTLLLAFRPDSRHVPPAHQPR